MPRLYIIPCGGLFVNKGINLTPGFDLGKMITIPVAAYLVETEYTRILIDTGFNPLVFEEPAKALGDYIEFNTPIVSESDPILRRLDEINLSPDDIDFVVSTHLHFDHAGGNRYFKHSEFIIQSAEIKVARKSTDYISDDWDHPYLKYFEIDGDYELIPGIDLIFTPGHSIGHQSVLIKLLKTGPILLTGDAVAHYEHWQTGKPGLAVDKDLFVQSINKLKKISKMEQCTTIFSHDPNQWSALKHLPEYYE